MHKTRESWLLAAAALLRAHVFVTEEEIHFVPRFLIGVGWPAWAVRRGDSMAATFASKDTPTGVTEVYMWSEVDHPIDLLSYLTHEMIHVIDDCRGGHRGQFSKIFASIGLVGRRTESNPSEVLMGTLESIADKLGDYPDVWKEI